MNRRQAEIAIIATVLAFATAAGAAVLCQASSGTLALRELCLSGETTLDAATLAEVVACPPDAVKVGSLCVDKYAASVWSIPPDNFALVHLVQHGRATLAVMKDGGATQILGSSECACPACTSDSPEQLFPPSFPNNGNWTVPLYAVSVEGVPPTGCVTWFQAEQACALSGKRLLTNEEWQAAAAGTPDVPPCGAGGLASGTTGMAVGCNSEWGAYDMVGNRFEWVAAWSDHAGDTPDAFWPSPFGGMSRSGGRGGNDRWGSGNPNIPGAPHRGGGTVFTLSNGVGSWGHPYHSASGIGFRCAR